MKIMKRISMLMLLLSFIAFNNINVDAATINTDNTNINAPIKNAPLHKHVSGVYRYGRWHHGDDGITYLQGSYGNDTPTSIYYNDGTYSGYLTRVSSQIVGNSNGTSTRWVSQYAGDVRLISYGLVPNN